MRACRGDGREEEEVVKKERIHLAFPCEALVHFTGSTCLCFIIVLAQAIDYSAGSSEFFLFLVYRPFPGRGAGAVSTKGSGSSARQTFLCDRAAAVAHTPSLAGTDRASYFRHNFQKSTFRLSSPHPPSSAHTHHHVVHVAHVRRPQRREALLLRHRRPLPHPRPGRGCDQPHRCQPLRPLRPCRCYRCEYCFLESVVRLGLQSPAVESESGHCRQAERRADV